MSVVDQIKEGTDLLNAILAAVQVLMIGALAGMRSPAARLSWDQHALFGDAYGWHRRWKEFTFGANSKVKSARHACRPPMK